MRASDTLMSIRMRGAMSAMGIKHLDDLQAVDARELLSIDGVGDRTLHEIRLALAGQGMHLLGERSSVAELQQELKRREQVRANGWIVCYARHNLPPCIASDQWLPRLTRAHAQWAVDHKEFVTAAHAGGWTEEDCGVPQWVINICHKKLLEHGLIEAEGKVGA